MTPIRNTLKQTLTIIVQSHDNSPVLIDSVYKQVEIDHEPSKLLLTNLDTSCAMKTRGSW